MLRQLFKDTVLYTVVSFLTKGIGFLLLPIYTRILSPLEYGQFDLIVSIGAVLMVIFGGEFHQSVMRFFNDSGLSKRERKGVLGTAMLGLLFGYILLLSVVGVLYLLFLNSRLPSSLQSIFTTYSIGWLVLYYFAISAFNLALVSLRALLLSRVVALLSLVSALSTASLGVYFVTVLKLGFMGLVLAQLCTTSFLSAFIFIYLKQEITFQIQFAHIGRMLRYSLPLIPSSLAVVLSVNLDRVMLGYLETIETVAIYGVGARLASIVVLMSTGLQMSLSPLIYKHKKDPNTPQKIAKLLQYFSLLSFLMIFLFAVFGVTLSEFIAGEHYSLSGSVFPILAAASLFNMVFLFFPGLQIAEKTGALAKINLVGVGVNFLLNFVLIVLLGVLGAALATLLTAIYIAVRVVRKSQIYFPIPIPLRTVSVSVVGVFAICLGSVFL